MATPVAVPFKRSSNFDCSHVRVPSANALTARVHTTIAVMGKIDVKRKPLRQLANVYLDSTVWEMGI
jgi:hypothetical protein